mgnify:CR=1 FL=1|jgi:hypothetical protein|tara:strand:+ start:331 stop:636 length:306 start_codon:yes stop_codon:yes gene_type:complete
MGEITVLYEEEERKTIPEKEKGDEDIYSNTGREELIDEEDEITDVDEGFMKGYEEGEKTAVCSNCHKLLEEDFVEQEFNEETYRFCSSDCATAFANKKAQE